MRTIKSLTTAKFDETVEIHMRLGVNVRHADQQLRGTLFLPHGTGRSVTVAVFAQGEKAKEAEDAGADHVGADDLAARVQEGFTDFDVAIATPDMMGTVGRLGRILGPQGKMPSPKAGTITFDIGKAVSDIKAGKIEYRTDRTGIVHVAIGKKSFDEKCARRELRRRARRDPAREAGGREGALHPLDHHRLDDGAGHQARHVAHPRPDGGDRGGSRVEFADSVRARDRRGPRGLKPHTRPRPVPAHASTACLRPPPRRTQERDDREVTDAR